MAARSRLPHARLNQPFMYTLLFTGPRSRRTHLAVDRRFCDGSCMPSTVLEICYQNLSSIHCYNSPKVSTSNAYAL